MLNYLKKWMEHPHADHRGRGYQNLRYLLKVKIMAVSNIELRRGSDREESRRF